MTLLYVTADAIGTETGGGKVTRCESQAMAAVEDTEIWQFPDEPRPWSADAVASSRLEARPDFKPRRAHFYAGTFTRTIGILKERGTLVSYTAAAHDIEASRREHECLGISFNYPHLTDQEQWTRYVRGYLDADLVICPSQLSKDVMIRHGCNPDRVMVIPHGFDQPTRIAPIPSRFVVGYLGQPGPDKGLRYLLDAWCRFAADKPDILLMIAGRGTLELRQWVRDTCPVGSFHIRGEVKEARDLYDACCVYVQPSATEGFGCEVIEARAHGRPVICSEGAGARDHATVRVPACDPAPIASAINWWFQRWKVNPQSLITMAETDELDHLTWESVRARYQRVFVP